MGRAVEEPMPELPEVENVVRGLQKTLSSGDELLGSKRLSLKIRWPLELIPWQQIETQKLQKIHRRAKYILFEFESGILVSHLGMTGSWRFGSACDFKKHDHLILHFKNKPNLIYNDPRKFGFVEWIAAGAASRMDLLGPEPFDKNIFAIFSQKLNNTSVDIKTALMNPTIIGGVGNIYACEALFQAKISAFKKSNLLKPKQIGILLKKLQKILKTAIRSGGSSIRDYTKVDGKKGNYQKQMFVYGREKQNCRICDTVIRRKIQNGRSTFFCPSCQKK